MISNYLDMSNASGFVAFCDTCLPVAFAKKPKMNGFAIVPCSICGALPDVILKPVRVTLSWRRLRDELNKLGEKYLDQSVNFWDSSADAYYDMSNFEVFEGKAFLL